MAIDQGAAPIVHLRAMCARIRSATAGRAAHGNRHDDADADVGTFGTDDAIGFDPFPMLELMQATGANYAVFGQVAGLLHGSSDLTGDLDLLWDGDSAAVDRMARVLTDGKVRLSDEDRLPVDPADYPAALGGLKVYFEGAASAGDLCTTRLPWGSLDIHGILRRKVWARDGGLSVPYVALEDLITMRGAVTGAKHSRRLAELTHLRTTD